ncbi:MAG: ABC transporter substrate-binding protein, partial [Magnetovibrio sp.]|nr:ABC transporter substrate-binding protein [Magnetovibrio sp.]
MGKFRNPNRRDVLIGAGATAATFSLGNLILPDAALAAAKPKKGGKLTYAILTRNSKHKSLKTAKHPYTGLHIRTKNVYNALTWVDQDINVQPEVATKWEAVKDDQTVWEVDIREGIKFHDGRDLTVDDVVSSYNFHRHKKKGTSFAKKMLDKVEKA